MLRRTHGFFNIVARRSSPLQRIPRSPLATRLPFYCPILCIRFGGHGGHDCSRCDRCCRRVDDTTINRHAFFSFFFGVLARRSLLARRFSANGSSTVIVAIVASQSSFVVLASCDRWGDDPSRPCRNCIRALSYEVSSQKIKLIVACGLRIAIFPRAQRCELISLSSPRAIDGLVTLVTCHSCIESGCSLLRPAPKI